MPSELALGTSAAIGQLFCMRHKVATSATENKYLHVHVRRPKRVAAFQQRHPQRRLLRAIASGSQAFEHLHYSPIVLMTLSVFCSLLSAALRVTGSAASHQTMRTLRYLRLALGM